MKSQPTALIFDFGNVLADFDYAIAGERLGPLGFSGRDFIDRLGEFGLADLLRLYEKGEITSREFHRCLSDLSGISIGFEEFGALWGDIFTPNQATLDLVRELGAAGYPLALGSNTNELHAEKFLEQFTDVLRWFDAVILSYRIGSMKPDRAFYLACTAALDRSPSECLFIDDLEENVHGAREAGLSAIRFHTAGSLVDSLRGLGLRF